MPTATRITHVIVRLGTGGAEQSLYRLLRDTRDDFTHQVICVGRPTRIGADIEALGVPVHYLDERRLGPWVLWRALQLLRRDPPDVLQGWMYYGNLLASWLGNKLTPASRIVWNIRQAPTDIFKEKWLTRWVMRRAAATAMAPDFVIYNSEAGRATHAALGYNKYPHRVISNGISFTEFTADAHIRERVREQHAIGQTAWVAMVCRYHPLKGVDLFLAAVRALLDEGCPARFTLAGTGMQADNSALSDLLRQYDLAEHVDLLGEINTTAAFLPALDVLVQASWREGTPNILLEAMACGARVVATRVGDSAHIVAEPERLVEPGDPQALAAAISGALAAHADESAEQAAKRIRCERGRLCERFAAEVCMQTYRDTYAQLLETPA